MPECDGCGRERDDAIALVVARRRFENVCGDCLDVLEQVLERQLVGNFEFEEADE